MRLYILQDIRLRELSVDIVASSLVAAIISGLCTRMYYIYYIVSTLQINLLSIPRKSFPLVVPFPVFTNVTDMPIAIIIVTNKLHTNFVRC